MNRIHQGSKPFSCPDENTNLRYYSVFGKSRRTLTHPQEALSTLQNLHRMIEASETMDDPQQQNRLESAEGMETGKPGSSRVFFGCISLAQVQLVLCYIVM